MTSPTTPWRLQPAGILRALFPIIVLLLVVVSAGRRIEEAVTSIREPSGLGPAPARLP